MSKKDKATFFFCVSELEKVQELGEGNNVAEFMANLQFNERNNLHLLRIISAISLLLPKKNFISFQFISNFFNQIENSINQIFR